MLKADKIEAVAEMKALFENANTVFVTDYQGINVADMTALRTSLRGNNVKYLIAKNTLLRIAAKEAGINDELINTFTGPTAVAFTSDDPAAAAKVLDESFKKIKLPVVKLFMMDGEVFSSAEIKRLADLPSRDILLAQVVAAVEAPFTSLIGSVDGFFRKLVGTIDALAEKKKSE